MDADSETLIQRTSNAPWLPPGGTAEVIRRVTPPRPMSLVRVLLRRADTVFCVPRPESGRFDLPTAIASTDDPNGVRAVEDLADRITGTPDGLQFLGAVKNIVVSPADGYVWPTPHAYFGVWTLPTDPIVDGSWLALGSHSELRDRHWYPLVG
ncbi:MULTISPECIES: NUDIX hydrolase [unclassified Pseudoclavibacter]|uniref:NUDIX hydrolase n=1 Tax=unclassified Pseudoclavibacter TaxID=2615177 RepID=UPI001BAA175C|nr:NUDIX hydrolase [Pseudoclavibacter sp. Marseille-Q4354]MBS3177258.1 NUDIX hydrolase [Pseudoclavibacter sp. Marseille-Q4354]